MVVIIGYLDENPKDFEFEVEMGEKKTMVTASGITVPGFFGRKPEYFEVFDDGESCYVLPVSSPEKVRAIGTGDYLAAVEKGMRFGSYGEAMKYLMEKFDL